MAEFLIPFDHLQLPYSTFNSEFCFMQRFVFSIYLIPRCKETVQPNLNFSPFGTCKLMMFPFTHLKFTFHYFFPLLNPEGWGKNIEDSLMQHTCCFIKGWSLNCTWMSSKNTFKITLHGYILYILLKRG